MVKEIKLISKTTLGQIGLKKFTTSPSNGLEIEIKETNKEPYTISIFPIAEVIKEDWEKGTGFGFTITENYESLLRKTLRASYRIKINKDYVMELIK